MHVVRHNVSRPSPAIVLPTLLATALLALVLLAAGAAAQSRTGAPKEFRGLAFGTELSQARGLTPVAEAGPDAARYRGVYYREDEPLRMGAAELASVAYYFREERLHSVVVVVRGDADAFLVKEQLIERFGPGRQVGGRYGWTWPDFSVVMERAPHREMHTLTYTWEPSAEPDTEPAADSAAP